MSATEFDEYGFRLNPRAARLHDDKRRRHRGVWFYEERDGITVVCEGMVKGGGTAHVPAKYLLEWARVYESNKPSPRPVDEGNERSENDG